MNVNAKSSLDIIGQVKNTIAKTQYLKHKLIGIW